MKRYWSSILLVVMGAALVWCLPAVWREGKGQVESAHAVLAAPAELSAGQIVVLDGTGSTGDHFAWTVSPDLKTTTIRPDPDGRRAVMASVPGTYIVTLSASNSTSISAAKISVLIPENAKPCPDNPRPPNPPGPEPGPPPPPPPLPAPAPAPNPAPLPAPAPNPLPAPLVGLALDVKQWAQLVLSPNRTAEAAAAAAGARVLAARIRAATVSGAAKILGEIVTANTAAFALNVPAWKPFTDPVSARLKELFLSGHLATDADWAAVLDAIAAGLEATR